MGRCDRYEQGWLDGAPEDAAMREHAAACPDCAAAAERREGYEAALEAARQSLGIEVELSPAAWVRLREGVDAAATRRRRRAVWAPLTAAVAAAAVAALVVAWPDAPAPEGESRVAQAPAAVAPTVAEAARPDRVQPAEPAEAMPSIQEGRVLAGGAGGHEVVAFGRHVLTLAPGARVRVDSWRPEAVVLHVLAGRVTCDVAREQPDERFEVKTDLARVRVLGTVFTVGVAAHGATRVHVAHGRVAVTGFGGETHTLDAGQEATITEEPLAEEATEDAPEAAPAEPPAPTAARKAPAAKQPGPRAAERPRRLEVIEIVVPPQSMERPEEPRTASDPEPERTPSPATPAEEAPGDPEDPDLRVIEIDVPPQRAPDTR